MIFQLENKNIHASDSGQGVDINKDTIVFLHGSGLSHIVWSLAEQFFSSKNYNVLSIDSVSYTHLTLPTILLV